MAILAVGCLVTDGATFVLFVRKIAVVGSDIVGVRVRSAAVAGVAVRFRVAAYAS